MRLPRMTTRRLMAIVAAVAVVVIIPLRILLWGIRISHEFEAEEAGQAESYYRSQMSRKDLSPGEATEAANLAMRFAKRRRKYERAARYPWLPVAPDPPAPR